MEPNAVSAVDPNSFRQLEAENPFQVEQVDLGREQFLQLLVAQLENQDPLNPQQDSEFVAQLATFSSLEQLIDMNTRIDGMLAGQGQLVNSQALNLIGREVLIASDGSFQLRADGADEVVVDLAEPADRVVMRVYDENGLQVREIELKDVEAGRQQIAWDGKDEDENDLDPGRYTFDVRVGSGGDLKKVPGMLMLPVEGVHIGDGGLFLVSGEQVIDFSRIVEIRQEGAGDPAPEAN